MNRTDDVIFSSYSLLCSFKRLSLMYDCREEKEINRSLTVFHLLVAVLFTNRERLCE